MSGDGGSFLERWSRRKAATRDGRANPDPAVSEAAPAPGDTEAAPVDEDALSDAELAEHHGLPDPEAMRAGDDVAAFMRAGVPARLRRLALRRLWRLNPEIVAHDGLTDYAEDYTDAATVVPGMKTLYQVGRGGAAYLQDIAERIAGPGEPAGPEEETAAPEQAAMPAAEPDAGVGFLGAPAAEPAEATDAGAPPADPGTEPVPASRPVRRHMVFSAPTGHDRDG